jgi:hypothetical protein
VVEDRFYLGGLVNAMDAGGPMGTDRKWDKRWYATRSRRGRGY